MNLDPLTDLRRRTLAARLTALRGRRDAIQGRSPDVFDSLEFRANERELSEVLRQHLALIVAGAPKDRRVLCQGIDGSPLRSVSDFLHRRDVKLVEI